MKMFIKELVRMAKNEDVNEFLCSVIPDGEDENCIVWELCPHCSYEVPLKKSFRIQHCPNCGERILPCSLCDMDKENCSECPLKKGKKKAITK